MQEALVYIIVALSVGVLIKHIFFKSTKGHCGCESCECGNRKKMVKSGGKGCCYAGSGSAEKI